VEGNFDLTSFQVTIAACVLLYLYNTFVALYYALPIDQDSKLKFVPGLSSILGKCVEQQFGDRLMARASSFMQRFSVVLEMALDAVFLLLGSLAFLVAAIEVDRGSRFSVDGDTHQYFTLGTFQLTFTHSQPPCLPSSWNSPQLVRASLAMCFFSLVFGALCLHYSLHVYFKAKGANIGGDVVAASGAGFEPLSEQNIEYEENEDEDEVVL
jgi:hypothetical protein